MLIKLIKEGASHDHSSGRGYWSSQCEFLVASLSYVAGYENFWSFPFFCYKHGGVAFLIPYLIMMVFVGMPLVFLEFSIGQFSIGGPTTCFRFSPIFTGLGIGMASVSALTSIYHNMVVAWSLYYLGASFMDDLPWNTCSQPWNNNRGDYVYCKTMLALTSCNNTQLNPQHNGTCYNGTQLYGVWNETLATISGIRRQSASEQFFEREVQSASGGLEAFGTLRWQLVVCLASAWFVVYATLIKGIKSYGKVAYVTTITPVIILTCLFLNGLTLEGMTSGVSSFFTPRWESLINLSVWSDAAIQVFLSLSAGFGGLITLSSYNRFNSNVTRNVLILCIVNTMMSIFAAVVVSSYLGFFDSRIGINSYAVMSGPRLVFAILPEIFSYLPSPRLWCMLLFVLLLTLGLGRQVALVETVVTSITDSVVSLRKYKTSVTLFCCIFLFGAGLIMCTNGGIYIYTLLVAYVAKWAVMLFAVIECLSLSWVYGWDNFSKNIQAMSGSRTTIWWRICCQFITPALVMAILVLSCIHYEPVSYGSYQYPVWAHALGWVLLCIVVAPLPVYAVYLQYKLKGTCSQRCVTACTPSHDWGPTLEQTYQPDTATEPSESSYRCNTTSTAAERVVTSLSRDATQQTNKCSEDDNNVTSDVKHNPCCRHKDVTFPPMPLRAILPIDSRSNRCVALNYNNALSSPPHHSFGSSRQTPPGTYPELRFSNLYNPDHPYNTISTVNSSVDHGSLSTISERYEPGLQGSRANSRLMLKSHRKSPILPLYGCVNRAFELKTDL